MRATFFVTLASLSFVAAVPSPQASTISCTDKCTDYTTWMSSCAGYEPSGSAWPSSCSEFCTSSSKQKAWNSCTSCMSSSGSGGDNGSLQRICAQLKVLGKISNSTKTESANSEDPSSNSTKKDNAAVPLIGRTGLGPLGATTGALGVAALTCMFF